MSTMRIRNARVFNSYTQTFEEKSVLIRDGQFAQLQETKEEQCCPVDQEIDARGRWMIPGLIDIHMHVESSMTIPTEFSRQALSFGVTTVVADPHEIANVFGLAGIEAFMASEPVMDIFYGIPSSVPSTNPDCETTGGVIGLEEVDKLLDNPQIRCLGEVMNFKELVSGEDTLIRQIIALCKKKRPLLPLEGHCPKISGADLAKFIASGVNADHTQQTPESIVEKITNGMYLEMQGKSIQEDTIRTLMEHQFYEYFSLVTDDVMPDHFLHGHLNQVLLSAVHCGLPMEKAIYCSTFTSARRMHLDDRGVIAPGKIADFVLLDSLEDWTVHQVYKNGVLVSEPQSGYAIAEKPASFPPEFYHSLHHRPLTEDDLLVRVSLSAKSVTAQVIEIYPRATFTRLTTAELPVENGVVQWQNRGLALMACIERYGKGGQIALAFTTGGIQKNGAVASSWAHDHHNLMVMGSNVPDMIAAANHLLAIQGGYCVCVDEKITACASLQVGGIVSDQPLAELAGQIEAVRAAMEDQLGYVHHNAVMSFATLSLPVSPEVKLTDKGLLIGKTLEFIPLIKEEHA